MENLIFLALVNKRIRAVAGIRIRQSVYVLQVSWRIFRLLLLTQPFSLLSAHWNKPTTVNGNAVHYQLEKVPLKSSESFRDIPIHLNWGEVINSLFIFMAPLKFVSMMKCGIYNDGKYLQLSMWMVLELKSIPNWLLSWETFHHKVMWNYQWNSVRRKLLV